MSRQEILNIYALLQSEPIKHARKFLQQAEFSSMMLTNLINDLLDLAKFETNSFKFTEKYFDLIEIV